MSDAIVAILQCAWVRNPERVRAIYARHPDQREDVTARLLFMGYPRCSLTGKRLRDAFGAELCDRIVWEESSTDIGGTSGAVFPPDPRHIEAVIEKHRPGVVLTFGKVADTGLELARLVESPGCVALRSFLHVRAPHPAARGAGTVRELNAAAAKLRTILGAKVPAR